MVAHSVNVREFDNAGLWHYRAAYERVIDGDTVVVILDLGMHIRYEMRVRLAGFSAPERNSPEGKAARDKMIEIFYSDRYTGAMLEGRYWPLRVVTEKAPRGDEVTSFERYVAKIYLCSETGELTDLVELLS